jgi:hypothetical protein
MITHVHCFLQAFKSRIFFSGRKAVPGTLELMIQFEGTADFGKKWTAYKSMQWMIIMKKGGRWLTPKTWCPFLGSRSTSFDLKHEWAPLEQR